jgi:hypothetical protein
MSIRLTLAVVALVVTTGAIAQQNKVLARGKMPATGTPASVDNPPCTPDQQAKNLGQQIQQKGLDAVGKATASLGLGGDPFNTRRLNQSVCVDLCVVVPTGASFKAKGAVTPVDWRGDLPSGLPETVNPGNWAAVTGPAVDSSPRGDVVCYTFKNWSHDQERAIGIEVTY